MITIDALDPETMALWRTVARIAQALDDQDVRWCLVGGLMVALFAIEAGLSHVGVPVGLHSAHGADYWDQFTSIALTAIRNGRANA